MSAQANRGRKQAFSEPLSLSWLLVTFFLTLHWAVLLVYRVTWVKRNQLLCYLQTAARRADWHEIICLGTFAALHRSISTQACGVCQSSWAQSRRSHKPNYLVTVEATLDSYWHTHLPAFLWMRFTVVRLYVTALPVSLSCSTGKQPRRIAIIAACCDYRKLQQSVKFFITSGRFHSNCLFIFTFLFEFFMVNLWYTLLRLPSLWWISTSTTANQWYVTHGHSYWVRKGSQWRNALKLDSFSWSARASLDLIKVWEV